jgi:hypothetical protein
MGTTAALPTVTFEDVQQAITSPDKYHLICTMVLTEHLCLIQGTIPIDKEETIINSLLNTPYKYTKNIIVYGKNSNDRSIDTRYTQLRSLGFTNVYLYIGGMFEWLLLQDIYGDGVFPTTKKITDILLYKPNRHIQILPG